MSQLDKIAGATGIPKRMFIGSEQDEQTSKVAHRAAESGSAMGTPAEHAERIKPEWKTEESSMSNETKWTPPPWVDEGPNQDGERCLFGADDSAVAVTIPVGSPDARTERSVANAHLIAAAPELYAALEDAVFRIRSTLILLECDDEFIARETEKARAALAKARGEHQ